MAAPAPTAKAKPKAKTYSKGELRAMWVGAGGNWTDSNVAASIALAESGGDPNQRNSIGATGLWQIYNGPNTDRGLVDPMKNARAAVAKFNASKASHGDGWLPWTTYTGADTPGHEKTYLRFLHKSDDTTGSGGSNRQSITGVTPAVTGAVNSVASVGDVASAAWDKVKDPAFWLHVAETIGGVILIIMGLRTITGSANGGLPSAQGIATAAAL